ncbi:MAG: quinohemoprotein amine dehydrogenase subunit alpha [Acidobacteriia bacterium]|nr:quinohemoprotein amine dehydrogenase subunit alpha [Terriglobia bacterium]
MASRFRATKVAAASDTGIAVTDALVIAKCGSCHNRDPGGNMEYVSWERTTPEGWQGVLKRMILRNGLQLTPVEARAILKYLSDSHGLTPNEAKPVLYEAERRIHEEIDIPNEGLHRACEKCHSLGHVLAWRRSPVDWKQLASLHSSQYKVPVNDQVMSFLIKTAPLESPEWTAWTAGERTPQLVGRWLITATIRGYGKYYGEMEVGPGSGADEFTTHVTLRSMRDGSIVKRSGTSVVYGGYAWRGRSKGSTPVTSAPDDFQNEMRETLWISPDQSKAEGRWFWGQYQEFGFDVQLQRANSGPTLLGLSPSSLKTGTQANRIRLVGDQMPSQVKPADVGLGSGITVRRIISSSTNDLVAEVDVAADAASGLRELVLGDRVLRNALAVYDRVDYIKLQPESALAAFGDAQRSKGYEQFEVTGYQRGADGKPHTADDVELGPVDVTWSLQVFYAKEGSSSDIVGNISPSGLFTPATQSPQNNFDVWVIATAPEEKTADGTPLLAKAYMVVTVPSYTFNGRRYVRDLDRWVDDGPSK